MKAGRKWRQLWLGLVMPVAAGLFARVTASGQTPASDAISREVSVFNYGMPSATTNAEAISHELSVFNYGMPSATSNAEAISREMSVFNFSVPLVATNVEAIAREVSVFNYGLPFVAVNTEAISREVSVFNFLVPSVATNLEAVSREVTVFNLGVVFVVTNSEAISRELSILNYGVPPVVFAIGSTNALGDEANQVPFALQTVLDLTNLSLTVQTDDSHLHILGVTPSSPEVVSMVLGTANSNGLPIAFTFNRAAIPTTNHVLAWLNFQGITNLDSAIVPLTITQFTATRGSGQGVPAATTNGQVMLIVRQPILALSGTPQFGITQHGLPGATYAIEAATNLAMPVWREVQRMLESGRVLTLTGFTNNAAQQFYRTEQVGP